MKRAFVLVHGSWMDGTGWHLVADRLRGHYGFEVHTPTQAGHGPGVSRDVTHAQVASSITDYITRNDLRDIVLVGHSFGGTVIQKVAEAVPERIARMVFWNAFVLLDGECLNDLVPPHYKEMFDALESQSEDGAVMLPFPVFREAFMNDADLALAQRVYDGLWPEQARLFNTRLDLKRFFALDVPKSYLYSVDDASLPHGDDTGWYPRFGNRLGLFRYVSMPGGHMALFTYPHLLADKIVEAGRN
jgi:pimeloyl-ACP methyl ester carboxylesterase